MAVNIDRAALVALLSMLGGMKANGPSNLIQACLLGVLLLALPALAQPTQYTFVTNNGTITITGCTSTNAAVVIPASVNGLPVTSVAWADTNSFNDINITNILFPDSVTNLGFALLYLHSFITIVNIPTNLVSIGDSAFHGCAGLSSSLILPGTLVNLGQNVFSGCTGLTNVVLGAGMRNINAQDFMGCSSLISMVIPGTITNIGAQAFAGCGGLTNLVISNGVAGISDFAFESCTNLRNLTIPASVTNLGGEVSLYDTSLTNFVVDSNNPAYTNSLGVIFNKNLTTLVCWPPGKSASYVIPNSVTSIGYGAFNGGLSSVTIPATVTNLSVDAFAFSGGLTQVTIPNSVTLLPDFVFLQCTGLLNVTLPATIKSIGTSAFYDCLSLTNLIIPGSVTNIGVQAFQACGFTNLVISNGVVTIGDNAFGDCPNLVNVTIPASATNLGSPLFAGSLALTNIGVNPLNPAYTNVGGAFLNKAATMILEFPSGKTGTYAIPNSVTSIGAGAFANAGITGVTFPPNLVSIGPAAFSGSALLNVTLPPSLVNLGSAAFSASALQNVTVSGSITNSPNGSLIEAFSVCLNLTNAVILNGIQNIGSQAFAYCGSLTNVVIPASVTNIWSDAFNFCYNLQHVYYQGNAPTAPDTTFGYYYDIFGSLYYVYPLATNYYLPGTTGWTSTLGGLPTAMWYLPQPLILNNGAVPGPGVRSNAFSFMISWATNTSVVIEGCTNLAHPVWTPLQTNALSSGTNFFKDAKWTNTPARYYRVRSS